MLKALPLLVVIVAVAVGAPPVAAGDGPLLVTQGGSGVANAGGTRHYVGVTALGNTALEVIDRRGSVVTWRELKGTWGLPAVGTTQTGLSRDGRTLVLGTYGFGAPS